jgi:hypothetical protein
MLLTKMAITLCPLSDPRLILVGVVVIIFECELCASELTEQQRIVGAQKTQACDWRMFPSRQLEKGRGHLAHFSYRN